MRKRKVLRRAGVAGIAALVLLVVTFPLYYPLLSAFIEKLRKTRKTSTTGLSSKDRLDLWLEYELNKRIRNFGMLVYRLIGNRYTGLLKVKVLILTTRGRKSGQERSVLLQSFQDGENLVVVAANSGRSSHPDWFYNLKATPTARVEIMGRVSQVRAEELSADEAAAFWPRILSTASSYARYQQATTRSIPLVRLVLVDASEKQEGNIPTEKISAEKTK